MDLASEGPDPQRPSFAAAAALASRHSGEVLTVSVGSSPPTSTDARKADIAVERDLHRPVWQLAPMPAPTSPRKQSLMPSTPLRRQLRGHGHALQAIVQIGKSGTNEAVIAQVTRALFDHELIKVKLGQECPETRFAVAERLAEEPGVNVVQILGRTILLYKRHPQKPRFEGEGAR
jgi:putative YhbY family RNA-binding protein